MMNNMYDNNIINLFVLIIIDSEDTLRTTTMALELNTTTDGTTTDGT